MTTKTFPTRDVLAVIFGCESLKSSETAFDEIILFLTDESVTVKNKVGLVKASRDILLAKFPNLVSAKLKDSFKELEASIEASEGICSQQLVEFWLDKQGFKYSCISITAMSSAYEKYLKSPEREILLRISGLKELSRC